MVAVVGELNTISSHSTFSRLGLLVGHLSE
jgi:hypothetical protein